MCPAKIKGWCRSAWIISQYQIVTGLVLLGKDFLQVVGFKQSPGIVATKFSAHTTNHMANPLTCIDCIDNDIRNFYGCISGWNHQVRKFNEIHLFLPLLLSFMNSWNTIGYTRERYVSAARAASPAPTGEQERKAVPSSRNKFGSLGEAPQMTLETTRKAAGSSNTYYIIMHALIQWPKN